MKKSVYMLLTALMALSLVLGGCGSAPAPAPVQQSDIPDFVLNPPDDEDGIYGIGQAKINDDALSRTTAENRAFVSLAQQLEVNVKNMFTDYTSNAGSNADPRILNAQDNITQTLTNQRLSGMRITQRYKASDGTWYALARISTADAKSSSKDALDSILNNELADYSEFRKQQAMDAMDAAIENTFGKNQGRPTVVDE